MRNQTPRERSHKKLVPGSLQKAWGAKLGGVVKQKKEKPTEKVEKGGKLQKK